MSGLTTYFCVANEKESAFNPRTKVSNFSITASRTYPKSRKQKDQGMKKEIKGENVTNKNLVTIKIKQRKEPITGLYVNHDNNWVAVLENTYDYVLDGYTFINREWIDHFHIETDRIADYIFSNSKLELINSTLLFPPALFDKDKLVEIWQHKAHKFWLGEVKNINEQWKQGGSNP